MRRFPVMLFAAGFGTRMGALTQTMPKPLIPVAGRPLLDHALDLCRADIVSHRVINLHYLGAQIARHLAGREVALAYEDSILETGGGLRAALPLLGAGPVLTLNTDAVWSGQNPLAELAAAWDDMQMDALLLLAPLRHALGHKGTGDFLINAAGQISRANGAPGVIYVGAQILRTDRLADVAEPVFSVNLLWDQMIAEGRAYGLIHNGGWCDVGQPESIALAERMLLHGG